MGFKILVSAACVAVIAYVGLFFWERYQAAQRAQERASFESFCELNYEVEGNVVREGSEIPQHIREGVAQCEAARMPRPKP